MTAKEAKALWCPFVQVLVRDDELWSNRPDSGFSSDSYCIGNKCMAWRWEQLPHNEPSISDGYCGLAGKQEPRRT